MVFFNIEKQASKETLNRIRPGSQHLAWQLEASIWPSRRAGDVVDQQTAIFSYSSQSSPAPERRRHLRWCCRPSRHSFCCPQYWRHHNCTQTSSPGSRMNCHRSTVWSTAVQSIYTHCRPTCMPRPLVLPAALGHWQIALASAVVLEASSFVCRRCAYM